MPSCGLSLNLAYSSLYLEPVKTIIIKLIPKMRIDATYVKNWNRNYFFNGNPKFSQITKGFNILNKLDCYYKFTICWLMCYIKSRYIYK